MKTLLQQIESGTISPVAGLIFAGISAIIILGISYLLTKTEKTR